MLFGKSLVATATPPAEATLSCFGVNTCKGQSACKTARNDCKGQNNCKGLGFVELTRKECDTAREKVKRHARKPA